MRVENSVHNGNASRCLNGWNMSHRYVIIVAYKGEQYYEVGVQLTPTIYPCESQIIIGDLAELFGCATGLQRGRFFFSSNAESMA